ncbi:MAG: hypothetical protein IJO55_07770 [Lachnospiraceae bacterium]|nr:hypothetical protein [Lachnospiraceae bacterium]
MDISLVMSVMIGIVVIALVMVGMATLEKRADFDAMVLKLVKVLGIIAVIMTLAVVIFESMPEKKDAGNVVINDVQTVEAENSVTPEGTGTSDAGTEVSENTIKIGVLEEPPQVSDPWVYEGNTTAIEAAFENRPTVTMEGVEYPVELISNRDLPSYQEETFNDSNHYMEAAEYFIEEECVAVIASYSTAHALAPISEAGIPVFGVRDIVSSTGIVFNLDQTEENFDYLQAQFILNRVPKAEATNDLIVLYDEQQPDPLISLEERDRFIAAYEAHGGEVVYASVSNQEQIELVFQAAIAAGEYNMIYAGLLYGNVMPEDVLIVRDRLREEMGESGVIAVIAERDDQQMLNKYPQTYNLQMTLNSNISKSIRNKTGGNSVSETWVQLYSAYDIILDALESMKVKEGLEDVVKTGLFMEVGAHGNVAFAGGTQAIYDSISAAHHLLSTQPEYMTYSADMDGMYRMYKE